MYEGLKVAKNELNANGRAGVRKLVVLVTDGTDNCGGCDSQGIATTMKETDGTHIITVGFGTGVDPIALKKIASIPQSALNVTTGAHIGPPGKKCGGDSQCKDNELCVEKCVALKCEPRRCQVKDYYFSPSATQLKAITLRVASEACPPSPPIPVIPDPPPPPIVKDKWVGGGVDCVAGGSPVVFTREWDANSADGATPNITCVFGGGDDATLTKEEEVVTTTIVGSKDALPPPVGGKGRGVSTFACMVPPYRGVATGKGPWKTSLRLKVNGVFWSESFSFYHTFSFYHHQCCHVPDIPIWPLIAVLPILVLTALCAACLIVIQRAGRLEMPKLQQADAMTAQSTPTATDIVTLDKTVTTTVRKAPVKKPYNKPKKEKKKEKKKWVVTAGTYLRNGAHVETNWGKFGEVGDTHMMDEDSDEEEKSESEGETKTVEVLHEEQEWVVHVPAPLETQLAHLDEITMSGVASPRSQQLNASMKTFGAESHRAPCPVHTVLALVCSLLCCVVAIVGIILLAQLTATESSKDEIYGRCNTNNASTFCPEISSCATCDWSTTCAWCGSSCKSVTLSAVPSDKGVFSGEGDLPSCGARHCPAGGASLPRNDLWATLAFVGFLLLDALLLLFCWSRRRRGDGGRSGSGRVPGPPVGGGKKKRAEGRKAEKAAKKKKKKVDREKEEGKEKGGGGGGGKLSSLELVESLSASPSVNGGGGGGGNWGGGGAASLWPAPKDSDPLAAGWTAYTDPETRMPFFRNEMSGEVTWSKPVQTPRGGAGGTFDFAAENPMYNAAGIAGTAGASDVDESTPCTLNGMPITDRLEGGWVELWDASSSGYFYGHPETGTTTWDKPTQSTGNTVSTRDVRSQSHAL